MKKMSRMVMWLLCVVVLSGCMSRKPVAGTGGMALMSDAGTENMAEVRPDRMLIWKAQLCIQIWSVSNAVNDASALAEHQGGFVEQKSYSGEESASVTLRVPAKSFKASVASLETLGTVTYRNIEGEDVTEQYIDVEASTATGLFCNIMPGEFFVGILFCEFPFNPSAFLVSSVFPRL